MDKTQLMQQLGYGILFQLGEGTCSAGCEICYERPAAVSLANSRGLATDNINNKELAGVIAQNFPNLRMPLGEVEKSFAVLASAGIKRVSLAGSEPTDHPDFTRILDAAQQNNLEVRIYTSGLQHKKMFHPALRVIVLHIDYRQAGVEKGKQMVLDGTYPYQAMMNSIKQLIDLGVKIELRINFEGDDPFETVEWKMIQNFYSQLTPRQQGLVLLKYSFTVRVYGENSLWHATPEGMTAHSAQILRFVDEFRRLYGTEMLSERTLFRCAFDPATWNEYAKKGGFRSMCNMELTWYWQDGQMRLGFCPPARTLVGAEPVTSPEEFWEAVERFQELFDYHNRRPSFEVCKDCELRGGTPSSEVICQGGCLGGKSTELVHLVSVSLY